MGRAPGSPLTIEPAPEFWRLGPFPALAPAQRRLREQLGLPTDRPIIMSGHQAEVWHPGILAKYLALDAASRRLGAGAAWLIVDQDVNDPSRVRYPIRLGDGSLRSALWRADPSAGAARLMTGKRPPIHPGATPDPLAAGEPAAGSVGPGLRAIREALAAHATQPSASRQLARAVADLASPPARQPIMIGALALARTDEFNSLVARIAADPLACIRAYNQAAQRRPEARIRPLAEGPDPEMPLWRVHDGQRRPARASDLRSPAGLAPRALLMTGLLRRGACDLFIHGTGGGGDGTGGGYEAVTDDWFKAWLGAPPPAPVAVVTATLRLPISGGRGGAELEEADRRGLGGPLAHRARHNPSLVGDHRAALLKREMVAEIADARRRGLDPLPAYRRMHAMIREYREANAAALERLDRQAAGLRSTLGDARIRADRTWPFPLYPDAMLRDLKARIDAEFNT